MGDVPSEGVPAGWEILLVDPEEPIPLEYEDLVYFVWDRLRCPLSMEPIFGDWGPRLLMFALWREHLVDYQVDSENHLLDFLDGGDDGDDVPAYFWEAMDSESQLNVDEPRAVAINISTWIDKARSDFLDRTRLFRAVVAGPITYPKHFPPPTCASFEDLKSASSKGSAGKPASRLLYNIDYPHIHELVSTVQVDFFRHLIGADNFRGAVDCLGPVGVVNGTVTNFLAVEWSAATIHAYPVSQNEAKVIGRRSLSAPTYSGFALDEFISPFPSDGIPGYDGLQGQGTFDRSGSSPV